ncbi:isoflavone reductase homolog [Dendrobium catenatum]|uniref:Isoflavone reductase n=1 Tax=Dendrobium catenatum TaxID=906689 RepID=A0A2I0WMU8_9ASPA|nr:isoflavone reductase homolog [Dendrobium catenatum]PKU76976.1 Isoflavone reductase [Dendrobium catenatum]
MAADSSRVLVIGSTGYFGKFMVDASLRLGHPTFALVRESTQASDPEKAKVIESFKSRGVNIIYGNIYEKAKLAAALKLVDVVICTLSHRTPHLYEDEVMLILAIKEAGNIKRYIPSEFGFDVERLDIMEPAKSILDVKARVRQRLREEGVPHTIVCGALAANWYFLPRIGQVEASGPPTDKVCILGDGNTKVVLVREEDTATYTIKAADDPRTLNKIMYLRPPGCVITHNEMIDLWEKKTGKKFDRIHIPEQEVIKKIQEGPVDMRGSYMIAHAGFVKGQSIIDIDKSFGVEASELYPEVKYASIDELLDSYL